MAMSHADGPVHQAKDEVGRVLDTKDGRLEVESGRALTLLLISTVLLAVIFAVIWVNNSI